MPRTARTPRFPFRAIKFNLPWMSYRQDESLQVHLKTCRDLKFWEAFLNMMAANRFNALTLWSLHPFTWMIRPRNFPEACGFSDSELKDWQAFWKNLFAMAKARDIETYLVNFNIFVSPELAKARGLAAYSIDWDPFGEGDTSAVVRQYTRECVTQVIDEYPDLTGLGITHGERMGGMTPAERQAWFTETFVAGMQAASRPVKFIHRAPLSAGTGSGGSTDPAVERMTRAAIEQLDLPAPIIVEMKFNWSHAHSTPKLIQVHGGAVTDAWWNPPPRNYRIAWMARNEDFFRLRWGEPGFIREHIARNGGPHVGGYFVGSETYIPAKDYVSLPDPRINWTWAFERQWFFYMVWGRLLDDHATPDEVFAAEFRRRYGPDGDKVFRALVLGSRVPLRLASFHKATWDFTLYAEGFMKTADSGGTYDDTSPLISVDELIDHPVLDPGYLSVTDFVGLGAAKRRLPGGKTSPLMLADSLEHDARNAQQILLEMPTAGPIYFEAADAAAWAWLGWYFADKLRGAVDLHAFRTSGDPARKTSAVAHLQSAAQRWRELVAVTAPVYKISPLVHLSGRDQKLFHWSLLQDAVDRDIVIARNA